MGYRPSRASPSSGPSGAPRSSRRSLPYSKRCPSFAKPLARHTDSNLFPGREPLSRRRRLPPVLYRCGDFEFGDEASDGLFVVSDRSNLLDGLARSSSTFQST